MRDSIVAFVIPWLSITPFDTRTVHLAMTDNAERANHEYDAKRYRQAIAFARHALSWDPDDAVALRVLGRAAIHTGDLASGITALEKLALVQPLDNEIRIDLAIAYGSVGRQQLSCDLLMIAATSGRMDSGELLRIARGLEAVNKPRLAMEACRQAGKLSPETAEVHYQMGYYAQVCGHPAKVSEALIRHAIDLEPQNLHFRIGLASLLIRMGRKYEAKVIIDHLVPERLAEVTCECCLKRIANLFFDCDDVGRAKLCAARFNELRSDTTETRQPAPRNKILL